MVAMIKQVPWRLLVPILWVIALYFSFLYAPNDAILGASQRIFYIHIGAAWAAFLALTVNVTLSILYLWKRKLSYDRWASTSVQLGIFFTTIVLITGTIWGKVAWGVWWTWDPRLTTTVIMWFVYILYLVIRSGMDDREKRARIGAIYSLIAFLDVPLVFMSIRWWRSIHPVMITLTSINMVPQMIVAMVAFFLAYTALYVDWLTHRVMQLRIADEVDAMREEMRRFHAKEEG